MPNYKSIAVAVLATSVGISGCASLQSGPSPEEQRLNRRMIDLEAQLLKVQQANDSQQAVGTYDQVKQLQAETRSLRGEIEQLQFEIEGMKRRQRELYLDIDRRLSQRPAASGGYNSSVTANTSPVVVTQGTASVDTGSSFSSTAQNVPQGTPQVAAIGDREAYKAAFALLRNGNYDAATEGFQGFLQQYPSSALADNAQYWLAEGYYVTRNFDRAKREFSILLDKYADSSKRPDGLLKLGYVHDELGNSAEARSFLNQVVQQYPGTTAASYAQQRLQKMTAAGR